MEDLGEESNLGRGHGVVVGEEKLELEDAACNVGMSAMIQLSRAIGRTYPRMVIAWGRESRRRSTAGYPRGGWR